MPANKRLAMVASPEFLQRLPATFRLEQGYVFGLHAVEHRVENFELARHIARRNRKHALSRNVRQDIKCGSRIAGSIYDDDAGASQAVAKLPIKKAALIVSGDIGARHFSRYAGGATHLKTAG